MGFVIVEALESDRDGFVCSLAVTPESTDPITGISSTGDGTTVFFYLVILGSGVKIRALDYPLGEIDLRSREIEWEKDYLYSPATEE